MSTLDMGLDEIDYKELYPLKVIKNKKDYKWALTSMEAVFDEEKGPIAEYAETLTLLIDHYEERHYHINEATGVEVVKFLMEQNNLKQKDLVGVLGEKSSVSEILNGKRPLNLHHIKKLSKKFHIKPATFV